MDTSLSEEIAEKSAPMRPMAETETGAQRSRTIRSSRPKSSIGPKGSDLQSRA